MQELDRKAMGNRIRKRREELNINREDFAEKIGVTTKFCSDIEFGLRGVSLKRLMYISDCLMISTDYILFGDTLPESNSVFIRVIEKCPHSKKKYLLRVIEQIVDSYKN